MRKLSHGKTLQNQRRYRGRLPVIGLTLATSSALGVNAAIAQVSPSTSVSANTGGAQDTRILNFSIPAGPIESVIEEYQRVTGLKVNLADARLGTVQSPGVVGSLTPAKAMEVLLAGTGVRAGFTADGVRLSLQGVRESVAVIGEATLQSPKYTAPLVDTPATVVVIPKQVIEQQNAANLRDVLRNTPGITMSIGEGGSGGTSSGDNVLVRGFSARNDIYVDGARDPGLVNRDAFDLETVEVAKGPSSVTGGRGNTGGSINMVTKEPETQPETTLRFTGGNGDYKRFTLDTNHRFTDTIGGRLNGVWQDTGYPGRDVAKYRTWGFAPSLTLGMGRPTSVTLNYFHMQQNNIPDWGLPTLLPDTAIAKGITVNDLNFSNFYGIASRDYEDTRTQSGAVIVHHRFGEQFTLRNLLRYGRNYRDAVLTPPRPVTTAAGQGSGDPGYDPTIPQIRRTDTKYQHRNDQIIINQSDATIGFGTGPVKNEVDFGLELSRDIQPTYAFTDLFTYGRPPVDDLFNPTPYVDYTPAYARTGAISDAHANTVAFYAFDTLRFGKHWLVNLGLRWDRVSADYRAVAATSATGVPGAKSVFGRVDEAPSGRAGITYKPMAKASIYAAFSTSFVPAFDGTLGLTLTAAGVNGQTLPPEKTRNVEFGTKWDFTRGLGATLSFFQIEKTNAKTTDLTGATVLAGDQRVKGVELGLSGKVTSRWVVFGGVSAMSGKVIQSDIASEIDAQLPYVPHANVNMWSSYQVTRKLTVAGSIAFSSGQFFNQTGGFLLVGGGTTPNPKYAQNAAAIQALSKYWLYNVSASYECSRHFTIQVNGLNLNNARYEDRGYDRHFLPGPTRQVLAGPVISW